MTRTGRAGDRASRWTMPSPATPCCTPAERSRPLLPNLWQDNFLTGALPARDQPLRQRAAQRSVAVPEFGRAGDASASLHHGGQASVSQWRCQPRAAEHAGGPAALPGRSDGAHAGESGAVALHGRARQELPQRLHRELHRRHRPRFQRLQVHRRLRGHRRSPSGQRLFAEQLWRRRSGVRALYPVRLLGQRHRRVWAGERDDQPVALHLSCPANQPQQEFRARRAWACRPAIPIPNRWTTPARCWAARSGARAWCCRPCPRIPGTRARKKARPLSTRPTPSL